MRSDHGTSDLKRLIIALAILAAGILAYDTWEVATGQADLNEHLPFFLPGVLCIFIGMIWYLKRHYDRLPRDAQERFVKKLEEDSFTNPKNRHGDHS